MDGEDLGFRAFGITVAETTTSFILSVKPSCLWAPAGYISSLQGPELIP